MTLKRYEAHMLHREKERKDMSTTEQEKRDLEKMKDLNSKSMAHAFAMIRMTERAQDEAALRTFGYRTKEDAIVHIVRRTLKEIDNSTEVHLRKYPDKG